MVVETVAYQKTLQWLIEQAMKQRRQYYVLEEFRDKRKKFDRIVDAFSDIGFNGLLYIAPQFHDFITQFNDYPDVSHDDILDSSAMALSVLRKNVFAADDFSDIVAADKEIPDLEYIANGMCP